MAEQWGSNDKVVDSSGGFGADDEIDQHNPLRRGWNKMTQSVGITGALATGDYKGGAQKIAEADTYQKQNPGTPEGRELMQAWERGDGISGGLQEVGKKFSKDWNESKSGFGAIRSVAKNLQAMGSGVLEQTPNMVAPMGLQLAGGAAGAAAGSTIPVVGTVAGGIAGALVGSSLGNTAVEGGGMTQEALQKAGVNPQDKQATEKYLSQNGDKLLGQAGVKGSIIGAVDTATMKLGHGLLTAPADSAAKRAITSLGLDAADSAAIKAASGEISKRMAADPIYKAAKSGTGGLARNAGVAALEPAGEFTGEYVGQGVATGDWNEKNAFLEAASSIGQGAATFAGQKAYAGMKSPFGKADEVVPGTPPAKQPTAPPLQIGNTPDPYISFPDGTVARRSEADAYVNSLPADQQTAARAKLMGLAPQPAKPSEQMGLTPTAGPSLTNAAITAVDSGAAQVNIDQAPAEQTDIVEQQRQQYQQETAALLAQQDQEAFDAYLAAIEDANTALDEAPGESVQALSQLDDISVPDIFDANSNTSDADFLRAMGATEQEIEDAITSQPSSSQASAQALVGTAQDEPGSTGQSVSADQTKQANLERIRKANNVRPPDSVQPLPATSSGQDGNQPAASVGLGSTDGNGLGANAAGSESGAVGQSGEQASGALRTPIAQGRQQPTTLGTQTSANAGPGFSAKDVQGVKNQSPAATDPQAGQAPVEAPQAVAGDAAPSGGVPAAGSAAVEGDGVEPKAKWLKAINDQNRLAGDTGVQLKVVDGKLTFYGDPKSTKQGRALEATLAEARKAGATQQEIIGSISQPAATNPAAGVGPASLGSAKADMDHLLGIDQKRTKALDRIAAGKAWWTKPLDAQEFITKNGLKDTHQSVKEGGKWYVRAKAVSQPTKSTNEKATEAVKAKSQQQEASAAHESVSNQGDGLNDHIRSLRSKAHEGIKQGGPRGDVRLNVQGKNLYVTFDVAVAEAKLAVANGMRPVPFQVSNTLDIGIGETDRVIAALSAPVQKPVTPQIVPAKPTNLKEGIEKVRQDKAGSKAPEIVVDKAEMRPYRKPDGSVGYEAVPIQAATPAEPAIQRNLADAMGTRSEFGGNQVGTSVNTAPVAINSEADQIAEAVSKADRLDLKGAERAQWVNESLSGVWGMTPDEVRDVPAVAAALKKKPSKEDSTAASVRAVEQVVRQAEQAIAAEQADKARLDAEEARKAANRPKSVVERRKDAILDGPSKIGQGTKRAVITSAVDNGYAIEAKMVYDYAAKKRDQETVDRASRAGYILGVSNENLPLVKAGNEAKARLKEGKYEKPEYRVYQGSDTKAPFREITKTEYDYAQELKAAPKDPRENYIKAAANSIGQLRKSDVDRVLNGLAKDNIDGVTRADLADYIKENHPDYAQEVDDVMAEIATATKAPADLVAGDRFKDANGAEFQVWSARQGRIEAHPVVDGKPVVNRDSVQRWATTDAVRGANPEYRTDIVMQPTVASPVHQDPGKAPEVATAPVVSKSMAKAASNEDKSQKEMRLWLLAEIDKAVKLTEDYADYQQKIKEYGQSVADSVFYGKASGSVGLTTPPGNGMITFDVPGDGKFKIRNSLRGLMEFRAKVEGKSGTGFTDKPTKPKGLPASTGVAKGSSNQIEALSSMLEELDFEAAVDYARETGTSLDAVKISPEVRKQFETYLKDGTEPQQFSPSRYWEYPGQDGADKDGNPIRKATLTKQIGASEYVALVVGTNATGFKYNITKDGKSVHAMLTSNSFANALKLAEDAINAIQPEVVKPKDTGWNMAGVGFAGKRYRGRNITLDDGREVVARIYENAGQYEDAEVKVDGVRKFARTDRYKAEKLADDFIATLTAKEQATDKLDLKGFTRTPTGNGSFNLTDGNMMVTVEPTSYGFQASHGSSAKSGPRLTEQQAIEWAAALRDESKRIQAREAKPAEPAKTFRNPDTLNVLHAPIEDKDWFKLKNGEEWQARQGYSGRGWSLVRNGNLHPEARNFESQSDFIRSVIEVTGQTQAPGQGVSTAEQVETAKELLVDAKHGDHISDDDRKAAEQALGIYSLNGMDDTTLMRVLYILDVNKATREKVSRMGNDKPRSINDLADVLGAMSNAAQDKAANEKIFNRAEEVSAWDDKVKELFNAYTGAKLLLDGIAMERGSYGVKWAEKNVGSRWTSQSFKVRDIKARLIAAIKGAKDTTVEASDEPLPAVTEAQARKQFEWRNMGQKDGTKSHFLFFFESPADKGTGAAMRYGAVELYPGASGWKVEDGDGTAYKSLADAKAAAIDAAIPVLQEQGYILKPAAAATAILDAANITGKERVEALKDVKKGDITPEELEAAYPASAGKFEQHNAIAQEYGYTVADDGSIALASGKESGVKVILKGSRFQIRGKSTDDLIYSGATVDSMGKFLESFWGAEKTPAKTDDSVKPEAKPSDSLNKRHTISKAEVLTPAGSLKADATNSNADSSVWYYQGDMDRLQFVANVTVNGQPDKGADEAKQMLAQIKAVRAAGWTRRNMRAGSMGTVWVYEKDDKFLTRAGMENAASDVMQRPVFPEDGAGYEKMVRRQFAFAKAFNDWLETLPAEQQTNRAVVSRKLGDTPVGQWARIEDDSMWGVNVKYYEKDALQFSVVLGYGSGSSWEQARGYIAGLAQQYEASKTADATELRRMSEKAKDGPIAEASTPTADESTADVLDAEKSLWGRIGEGTATVDEFKVGFENWVNRKDEIISTLMKSTKDQLLKMRGLMYDRYKNEPKSELVDAMWRDGTTRYVLSRSFSHGMGKNAWLDGIRSMVESTDSDQLAQYAQQVKANTEEAIARIGKIADAIKDPKTLEDYITLMRATMRDGKTFKESRMMLTVEQRAQYDELSAEDSRSKRKANKDDQRTSVAVAGQTVDGNIIATKHTKTKSDLFVVQLAERVSKEDYATLNAGAKRIGGYYSTFRGAGAVPGFTFTDRSQAEAFVKLAQGDSTDAQAAAQENRDSFEDDRSQTAVQRLTEMADKLESQADESLNYERKANTARRARFASAAEATARAGKAMAKTMRNIAQALSNGTAKYIDRIRTKTQIDALQSYIATAQYEQLKAKYQTYAEQEKRKGLPPDMETADFAEFPSFTSYRSDLATLARQLLEVDGTKLLGQRLLKEADDVTDSYLAFAKENFYKVSTFSSKTGGVAAFSTRDAAEAAISRSGYKGKAISYQVKRGEHTVIMSPSEAIARGIWNGDGDKRITLSAEVGAELVEKIGKAARRGAKVSVPWQLETAHDRRKMLTRMGIETPAEFRAALREFIGLREQAADADRVKMLERAMVGRRNDGMDFFPTPESIVDEMIAAADIQPDMAVLEPSAGMGHIADRIRATGAEPDVIEMANDRKELLEEKGFTVVGSDFMEMKPREFFTWGDVFRAPDGTEGVMQGGGGMGSNRAMLRPINSDGTLDMRQGTWHNRDDLTGIRHLGTASGYDRILMNPPFSEGRDIQHVQHAYTLLKPGGRIVAIMGESAFTNQNKRATEFREWLESVGGTEEKLADGSFNDPSLPVNTGANARMVVIEKQAEEAPEGNTSDVVFSQGLLSPASLGPKPTLDQIQRLVDKVLQVAKNVIPVTVIGNPSQVPGVRVPVGSKPTGALIDGRIYLFADNIKSTGDAYVTLFHELFHLGLQKVIPAEDYASMLIQFSRNLLVQKFVRDWKASPEGVEKEAKMNSAAYEALATEEAMAMISEELSANDGIGAGKMPGLIKAMLSWFARAADRLGFPANFGNWMRKLTQNDAEKFVTDMVRASMGGDKILGRTQAKYGTTLAEMTAQTRLSAGKATNQTDSMAFKSWFSGSKVVDAEGKPLMVYHGTSADFAIFKPSHGDFGDGIYMTSDAAEASDYANNWSPTTAKDGANVMPVYASLQNPYYTTPEDRKLDSDVVRKKAEKLGHDGIIRTWKNSDQIHVIAFNPTQIKSAIGNNGNFDASNPDIRFSQGLGGTLSNAANSVRDVNLPAGYKVGDLFNAVPGKLNWWHRTLGTQYNLAQRSPAFKRVYDAVQTFINDVSYFATEAADMAPNILPKLESWKDLAKSPLSAADTKALSAPVFEGTLIWARDESGKAVKMETLEAKAKTMTPEQKAQRLLRSDHISEQMLKTWKGLPIDQYERLVNDKYEDSMLKAGIVFKDAELTALFGLSDKQIALYREFRKATDKSLANLAIADMLRFGGKDADPVRDVVLESKSVKDAADTLSKYLRSLADLDPDRATVLMDTANKMIDKGDKAQGLMDRGYAPLSRFGSYTLDVVDANGERAYFGMFESAAEASRMRRKMEGLYPGSRITQGTVSEQAYKMFAGVSPETLELFGDMLGLETQGDDTASQAFQEYLKLAKSSRSAMKRLIQRKGIAGFSEDAGRVLAGFVYSNARQTATSLHMGEMTQAAADNDAFRNQGETQDAAVKLVDYIKNPQEEAQKLRGLLFAQYIGGSVASAMVNMTQPITMTFPWLSQYGGVASAAKQMTAAIKDVGKPSTGDTKLDAALRKAEEDGTVSPQEVHQLLKQSQGRSALQSDDGTRAGYAMALAQNTVSRFSLVWGKLFSVAEQFNRRVTFIAAYRTAVAQGMADPDEFARKAISETQGVYNKGNKPAWARGAVGSTLFTFKQYSIAYVEMLSRMAKSGPEGKKAALLALAVLFLLSGAGGMPGADDLDDVISGAMQAMGYNFDSKMKRKEFFVSLLGEGGAQFVERGVSGLPGVPLDVSGRMGLGNLIPGTGLLTKKADHTRDVAEIAGPAGDFVKRGFDAAGKLITGNVAGAVNSIAPKAIQNVTQAFDMANMGMYRDTKGMKVLDTDMGDAVVKAIGFQPNDVKRAQDANSEVARMIGLNKIIETEIANRWAIGIFEKDTDKVQAARDDLAEWNRSNPESPIRINFTQIRSRVQKMNQTKAERIAKTAPREIRAAVRKELADAR